MLNIIDAYAYTYGVGTAGSYTSHSLETPEIPVTVGGTDYDVTLAYGGYDGAKVQALASQNTATGATSAYANIYSYVALDNNYLGDESIYGEAEIYSDAEVIGSNGEASSSASGIAGYSAMKSTDSEDGSEQVWGAVSGTATSDAIAEGECLKCSQPNYAEDAGYAYGESYLYTYSDTYTDVHLFSPDEVGSYAYSDLYSDGDITVDDGTYVLGESTADGLAQSGAWDASTSSNLVKQNGVNENVYSSVNGGTSVFNEGFIDNDYANSYADLDSEGYSYYDTAGYKELWSEAYFDTYANAYRDNAYVKSNPQRVTSTGYVIDGVYDAVARQSSIKTESSADKVNVASGAHALNRGDFYSEAYIWENYAEYVDGYMETWTDIYNYQYGPKFILSATMLDDAGSYIRLENIDNTVTLGYTPAIGVNIDDIDFMNWIEGSSLVNNMYPVSQDWTTTFTLVPGSTYMEDYDRYFDNSGLYQRYSDAEIEADVY